VNGDGTNIVSGNPILSTDADTNSSAGAYSITIEQGTLSVSETNYGLSLSNGALTIAPASSSNVVVSSLNPSTSGDSVMFTATVSPVPPATTIPTGSIIFSADNAALGTVPLIGGVAAISTMSLPPGTNAVEAAYVGERNYLGSTNGLQQSVTAVCSSTNYILSIVMNSTNTLTFTFIGTTNSQYRLLRAADPTIALANWSIVPGSTNTAFDGTWQYTVTNNEAQAFFRVQAIAPCP
jgi:hypothetical protein